MHGYSKHLDYEIKCIIIILPSLLPHVLGLGGSPDPSSKPGLANLSINSSQKEQQQQQQQQHQQEHSGMQLEDKEAGPTADETVHQHQSKFSTPLAGLPGTLSTGKQERTALFRQAIADAERAGIWKLLQVCGDA